MPFRLISISGSLPESSSIKMIEIWMLFSLLLPFLEVVLQSYVNYLRCQEANDIVKRNAVAIGTSLTKTDGQQYKLEGRQVLQSWHLIL
jgi:hypothetical protein